MDSKVDPCDDFYDFACGAFVKETLIPDDKTSVNGFNVIHDKLQEQLRVTIESPTAEDDPRPYKLVKSLYKACMNKSKIPQWSKGKRFADMYDPQVSLRIAALSQQRCC